MLRARACLASHALQDLAALHVVVQGVDVAGLLGCWDYLAFPLLLITDSVHASRMQQRLQQQQQQRQGQQQQGWGAGAEGQLEEELEVAVPAALSDRVAEAVLGRAARFSACLVRLV